MRSRLLVMLALAALGACSNYPRDVVGTFDRVRASKVVRVGMTSQLRASPDRSAALAFIDRVARRAGAKPAIVVGDTEPLLAHLEQGSLDLVMGDFADDSPWADDVALIEPLSSRQAGERTVGLTPVARNGENQWIALLEQQARDLKAAR